MRRDALTIQRLPKEAQVKIGGSAHFTDDTGRR
jgi:hypothetical protein